MTLTWNLRPATSSGELPPIRIVLPPFPRGLRRTHEEVLPPRVMVIRTIMIKVIKVVLVHRHCLFPAPVEFPNKLLQRGCALFAEDTAIDAEHLKRDLVAFSPSNRRHKNIIYGARVWHQFREIKLLHEEGCQLGKNRHTHGSIIGRLRWNISFSSSILLPFAVVGLFGSSFGWGDRP